MIFRFPDKPATQLSRSGLADIGGGYLAQLKMDGWRCVVERTATGLTFTSRHNKPIPIGGELAEAIGDALRGLPVGTILDGEWLARRPAARDEALWLFDAMQIGRLPLWGEPTFERLAMLRTMVPAEWIVPTVAHDYGDFFDAMQGRGDAEGIVLKRREARYIGSFRASALNPGWAKSKWRGGEAGTTLIEPCAAMA